MTAVPPEAATEATDELTKWMLKWGWITDLTEDQVRQVCRDAADRVLEVGAPHIRAAAPLTLVWRDERGEEICTTGPLPPGTRNIAIPLDAQSVDLMGSPQ